MEIHTVGVIGAGLMGNGIAQVCAWSGLNVVLYDIQLDAVERAVSAISGRVERHLSRNPDLAQSADQVIARINPTSKIEELAHCNFVIEAATEDFAVKKTILRALEATVGPEVVLASNTSSVITVHQRLVDRNFGNWRISRRPTRRVWDMHRI